MSKLFHDTALAETGFACYEGSEVVKDRNWQAASEGRKYELAASAKTLFTSKVPWLAFAAEKYKISPKLEDYIIVPVSIILSDVPNRNGRAFPLGVLTEFDTEHGCLMYQTWRGKPTFYEHANHDHSQAKGVIFDAALVPASQYYGEFYSVDLLLGFDRLRDPELANRILGRQITTYSMGSYSPYYECSYCGSRLSSTKPYCEHTAIKATTRPPVYRFKDRLVYLNMGSGTVGFETSAVGYPAAYQADSDTIYS